MVSSRGGSAFYAGFTKTIEQVGKGQDRVRQHHPWSGVAHYYPDFFTFCRGVTVHRAFAAGGFVFLKRAMVQTTLSVRKQFLAILAEHAVGMVLIPAETTDHYFNSPGFPSYAF